MYGRFLQDFYSKLSHLRQYHKKYKHSKRLIDKIADVIVQCSPTGSFNRNPSLHQIWKWITGLLEEYMALKQSLEGGFYHLCDLVNADNMDSLIEKVEYMQHRIDNEMI